MMDRLRSRFIYLLFIALLLSGGAAIRRFGQFDGIHRMVRVFEDKLTFRLMQGLVFKHHLPRDNGGRLSDGSPVTYILGGTQDSLSYKWKTIGRLYTEGAVRKILILHRPGITEYSPALGRNLTNDEWVTGMLKDEGVAVEILEFVPVPAALFGTFAEARVISALARSRRVKRLVLVSSALWPLFSGRGETGRGKGKMRRTRSHNPSSPLVCLLSAHFQRK
jgi:hypothetical protein